MTANYKRKLIATSLSLSLLLSLLANSYYALAAPTEMSERDKRLQLAYQLVNSGHVLAGRKLLLPMCHRPNTTAQMYCLLAQSYLEDPEQDPKMNNEVSRDLQTAMKLDPDLGEAYRNMAEFCNVQGQYEEALKYEDKALKAKRPDLSALKQQTGTYSSLGRYEDALKSINEYITRCGPTEHACFMRGTILQELKRYDEASAAYRLSLNLRNQDRTVLQLARCLDLAGKYQDGINELTKLLKTNANDGEAFALRARLWSKNKNSKMALADFTRAIELEPAPKLYEERAAVYAQLGQKEAAAKDLAKSKESPAFQF